MAADHSADIPTFQPSFAAPTQWLSGGFADWLRDAMAARGFSPNELAMRSGVSHDTIRQLSDGTEQPTLAAALKLLQFLEGRRTSAFGYDHPDDIGGGISLL